MDKLLFLTNELMNPTIIQTMHIPFTPIGYGITKGKMYQHFRNQSTFIMPPKTTKSYGNDIVYGALMLCKDFDFYARILDAYHVCSMSTLYRNHPQDIHHRVSIEVTPIFFKTLDELSRLQYREGEPIKAESYIGNQNHPKIKIRLRQLKASYRLIDGIHSEPFKQLFGEVIS